MNAGEVDAFAQYDPWADIAVSNGATKFFSDTFDEGLKDYLCCFVGMSTKTLNARPEIGPMLSEGFAKAAEFLANNPEAVSYTHLDVYKRQSWCWLRQCCRPPWCRMRPS